MGGRVGVNSIVLSDVGGTAKMIRLHRNVCLVDVET